MERCSRCGVEEPTPTNLIVAGEWMAPLGKQLLCPRCLMVAGAVPEPRTPEGEGLTPDT